MRLFLLLALTLVAGCVSVAPPAPYSPPDYSGTPSAYERVDDKPRPVEGWEALADQARYPAMAQRAGIEGRVIVNVVIDTQGNVRSPQVLRGLGGGTDEEALRVVRAALFAPGRVDGMPVDVAMRIALAFDLDGPSIEAGPYFLR